MGTRRLDDYPPEVVGLLHQMNTLARRLQKRRQEQGQIVLDLPEVELVLDEEGKVVDAVPEDQSFTHTLIEMFMVEANEAVARLLDTLNLPFIRRTHPEPEITDSDRLRTFVQVSGFKLPKTLDRKVIQAIARPCEGQARRFCDQSRGAQEPDKSRVFPAKNRALRAGERALLSLYLAYSPLCGFDCASAAGCLVRHPREERRQRQRAAATKRKSTPTAFPATTTWLTWENICRSTSAGRTMPSASFGR